MSAVQTAVDCKRRAESEKRFDSDQQCNWGGVLGLVQKVWEVSWFSHGTSPLFNLCPPNDSSHRFTAMSLFQRASKQVNLINAMTVCTIGFTTVSDVSIQNEIPWSVNKTIEAPSMLWNRMLKDCNQWSDSVWNVQPPTKCWLQTCLEMQMLPVSMVRVKHRLAQVARGTHMAVEKRGKTARQILMQTGACL